MSFLLPFLALYRRHSLLICLGILVGWHWAAGVVLLVSGRLCDGRASGAVYFQLHATGRWGAAGRRFSVALGTMLSG